MEDMGFRRLDCDHSVFIYERNETKILIPVHVDDLVIASKSRKAVDDFKKAEDPDRRLWWVVGHGL
jgi:hypothetical protein